MALRIRYQFPSGYTLGYSIERIYDNKLFDFSDLVFKENPSILVADLPEETGSFTGRYADIIQNINIDEFINGNYIITIHNKFASNMVVGVLQSIIYNGDDSPVFPSSQAACAPTATEVASAVWDELLDSHTLPGTTGAILGDNLDATVSSRLAAESYSVPPSVAEIVTAVWNESISNYNNDGTFGYFLDASVSSRLSAAVYDATPTATQIATAVWTDTDASNFVVPGSAGAKLTQSATLDPWATHLPDSYPDGSAGAIIGKKLDVNVSSRSTFSGESVQSVTEPVTVGTNLDKSGYVLSPAGLDAINIESGVNARQALSPILAAAAGVVSGAGTGTITIQGGNVSTTRILATTDAEGNRTSVLLILPT